MQEAKIRRIIVLGQPRLKSSQNPTSTEKARYGDMYLLSQGQQEM
jgi:hypothetical protein